MDALWTEFEQAKRVPRLLDRFHDKISHLKFLDPACGCGNFLIVTYRELKLLELEILKMKVNTAQGLLDISTLLKVNIEQFYGIEIEDFPCQVAQVGMWLMDHLMNTRVSEQFGKYYIRLPLLQTATIVHGNALRINWCDIVPKEQLSYILGNPPFVGASMMSETQKTDAVAFFGNVTRSNSIDYVGAWYHKAAACMVDTSIRSAFVSTNSITQGEQVAPLWEKLINNYKIHIDFCYKTFKWSNEARGKAAVHCVIIGFSSAQSQKPKCIYSCESKAKQAKNISPYLIDAPNILVSSRSTAICDVPRMTAGNKPADGGNLILSQDEMKTAVYFNKETELDESQKEIFRLLCAVAPHWAGKPVPSKWRVKLMSILDSIS